MVRLSRKAERDAWTTFVDGPKSDARSTSKYSNQRCEGYASKHEADVAAKLHALSRAGKILDLKQQVRITLVPGRPPLKPIIYIADFTYSDLDGTPHCVDAKGFKTEIYRLKKRMAALLLNLEIEEV
jgi:hypothetical protein